MTPRLETPSLPTLPESPPPVEEDPFRYGSRFIRVRQPDGTEKLEEVPLSLEDVLHPQEEDDIPMRPVHFDECAHTLGVFRSRLGRVRDGDVLSDCNIDFGVPGLRDLRPDLIVFDQLEIFPDIHRGTFHLGPSGGRCLLVMEIVSPEKRVNDVVHKLREYHQAGLPHYILVDQEREGGPRRLRHFRHGPTEYEEMPLDAQGGVLVAPLGVRLEMRDNQLVCLDADTGKELGDYLQVLEAKEQEAEARRAAEARERQEAEARRAAEQRERAAEQRQQQEAEARRAAEQRERQEAEARRAAEERLREVEAELRRLRGQVTDQRPSPE